MRGNSDFWDAVRDHAAEIVMTAIVLCVGGFITWASVQGVADSRACRALRIRCESGDMGACFECDRCEGIGVACQSLIRAAALKASKQP